jgi:hypothetical protein
MRRRRTQHEAEKGFNRALWTLKENRKYLHFLLENYKIYSENLTTRRLTKIHVQMSKVILTRSPDQCRSHHQKMIKHHNSIPEIVDHILMVLDQSGEPEKVVKPWAISAVSTLNSFNAEVSESEQPQKQIK